MAIVYTVVAFLGVLVLAPAAGLVILSVCEASDKVNEIFDDELEGSE